VISQEDIQKFRLTKEQVFRRWKCAVKDDDRLVDALIQTFYETMIGFDAPRADRVIGLIIDRHETAKAAVRGFLRDLVKRSASQRSIHRPDTEAQDYISPGALSSR
jgi:hypothetical protein